MYIYLDKQSPCLNWKTPNTYKSTTNEIPTLTHCFAEILACGKHLPAQDILIGSLTPKEGAANLQHKYFLEKDE